jgi:outer membrane protein OmpA-like peptidoglycan-associated protein
MSFKHASVITFVIGSITVMAACQASFQAGAGSAAAPSSAAATGGAPTTPTTTATAVPESGGATQVSTTATAAPSKVSLAGGKIVVQGSLAFDTGRPILLTSADNETILSDLKALLEKTPNLTQMRIEGHTDNTGTTDANVELSGQRAAAIKKALIEKGIAKERLLAVGFGEKKPIADNATETGRAQNQRIEFRVATWNGKNYLNQDPTGGGKSFE